MTGDGDTGSNARALIFLLGAFCDATIRDPTYRGTRNDSGRRARLEQWRR
jgi:hypothetical protein